MFSVVCRKLPNLAGGIPHHCISASQILLLNSSPIYPMVYPSKGPYSLLFGHELTDLLPFDNKKTTTQKKNVQRI